MEGKFSNREQFLIEDSIIHFKDKMATIVGRGNENTHSTLDNDNYNAALDTLNEISHIIKNENNKDLSKSHKEILCLILKDTEKEKKYNDTLEIDNTTGDFFDNYNFTREYKDLINKLQ